MLPCYVIRISIEKKVTFLRTNDEDEAYALYWALDRKFIDFKMLMYYPDGLAKGDNGWNKHGEILLCHSGRK